MCLDGEPDIDERKEGKRVEHCREDGKMEANVRMEMKHITLPTEVIWVQNNHRLEGVDEREGGDRGGDGEDGNSGEHGGGDGKGGNTINNGVKFVLWAGNEAGYLRCTQKTLDVLIEKHKHDRLLHPALKLTKTVHKTTHTHKMTCRRRHK